MHALRILLIATYLLAAASLQADTLILKSGRELHGEVTESGDKVKIKTRNAEYTLRRSQVDKIVKAKSIRDAYREKLAALEEEDADGCYELAMWCKEKKLHNESKQLLNRALIFDPGHKKTRTALGYQLVDGAWVSSGAAKTTTGTASAGTGKKSGAAKSGLKKPDAVVSEEMLLQFSNTVKKEGDTARAKVQATEQKGIELYNKGLKAFEGKRYDESLKLLSESLKLHPKNPYGLYLRGRVYSLLRRTEEALADLDKAIELMPEFVNAIYLRARVYFDEIRFKEAIADIEKVLNIQPGNQSAQNFHRILTLVHGGPKWPRKSTRKTAHYVVTTNGNQRLADLCARELERIYRGYANAFKFKGDEQKRKFNVRVFATKEGFMQYSAQTTGKALGFALGYYASSYKELVLWHNPNEDQLVNTLYHEGFHQFLDYFISNAPTWFNEGLAQYFETAEWKGRQAVLGKPDRNKLGYLQRTLQMNRSVPLKNLLRLSHQQFMDQRPGALAGSTMANVHYVESWSFIHFLIDYNKGQYRKVIRKFYLALKAGKNPDQAFEEVFGKASFLRIEKVWKGYVSAL